MDESAFCALAVSFNPNQDSGLIRRRFIMRKRQAIQVINDPAPAFIGIHRFQAGGQGFDKARAPERQHLNSLQQWLKRLP